MVEKEIAVKRYVVRLTLAEREEFGRVIRKGKGQAQLLAKARIL